MSDEEQAKLTNSQRAKLAGLASMARLTHEQRVEKGRKAGKQTFANRGKEFYVRLALRRWGKQVALYAPNSEIAKKLAAQADPEQVAARASALAAAREDAAWARDFILRGSGRGVPRTRPSAARRAVEEGLSGPATEPGPG